MEPGLRGSAIPIFMGIAEPEEETLAVDALQPCGNAAYLRTGRSGAIRTTVGELPPPARLAVVVLRTR